MKAYLAEVRRSVKIGVVGGSDLHKIKEQLGESLISDVRFRLKPPVRGEGLYFGQCSLAVLIVVYGVWHYSRWSSLIVAPTRVACM